MIIVPANAKFVDETTGKHKHLFAKPENYTPPTKNPEDCICGAKGDPKAGRLLIANCPCCDGIQSLVEDWCDCPDASYMKMRVTLPPDRVKRLRYIDNSEPIQ
jgi:hypothetical protein